MFIYEVLVAHEAGMPSRIGVFSTKEKAESAFDSECWFMRRCTGKHYVWLLERQLDKAYEGRIIDRKDFGN